MRTLGILPGARRSWFVVIGHDKRDPQTWEILEHEKIENADLLDVLADFEADISTIEMVEPGLFQLASDALSTCRAIGRFEDRLSRTCRAIGRFEDRLSRCGRSPLIINRSDTEKHIAGIEACSSSSIRNILLRIWPEADLHAGEWQALAVAVCAIQRSIYNMGCLDLSKLFPRRNP